MAYCRFGDDSDVYMYEDIRGGLTCIRCVLKMNEIRFATIDEAIFYLKEHIKFGHKVPEEAIQELEAEEQQINLNK